MIGAPMLAAAPAASAAAIHACVNKRTGATRIVSAKLKRCRRGEQKLAWNTTGPAGPGGADGKPGPSGPPGSGGAVAGFSAVTEATPLARSAPTVLVSKPIPPGSYLLSGKTVVLAEAETAVPAAVSCRLTDNPGTAYSPESTSLDIGAWESVLTLKEPKSGRAVETVPMQGALTSAVTTTIAVVCVNVSEPTVNLVALFTQIAALQTSHNG